MSKCRVVIVDDSALMRQLLRKILEDGGAEVVGVAQDPYVAREMVKKLKPDVLTLDVEMPRMDGLTFLEKLMKGHPMPVVMISSLTEQGCETTLRALALGAVDYIAKPKLDVMNGIMEQSERIVATVKAAAGARVASRAMRGEETAAVIGPGFRATHKVVALGASTGGTEALKDLLMPLPADFPGVVIVQHMPEKFTAQFAKRLDGLCQLSVREAKDGDRILPGHALLAPGNYHMEVVRRGAEYTVRVFQGEPVNRHRPSVDVLFDSCAKQLGENAAGVIMTGMGGDGAKGLLAMRKAGAYTVAQDEASSVVFGMPREAIALGAAMEVLPLGQLAGAVAGWLRKG